MLIYGAHLLRNGAALILDRMMARRLAHAPGHQRRRHDPRLGIRLARPLDRKRPRRRGPRLFRHLGRDGTQHPHCPAGGGRERRGLRPRPGPVHRRGRRDAARSPRPWKRPFAASPAAADARRGPNCCWPCGGTALRRAAMRSRTAGSRPRSWPPPSATTCPSPFIRASATTSSPTIRCSTARRSAGPAQRDFAQFCGGGRRTRRRRGALGRLGDHGPAGLREEPELRQQPAAPGRPADRRRPRDLRRRPPGRRRLGLDHRRAAQDQSRLLPAVLQELRPHGRHDALPAMRQRGFRSPPAIHRLSELPAP